MVFDKTINYLQYYRYKKLKESLNYYYLGINLSEVLAWDLIRSIVFNKKPSFKEWILLLFLKVDVLKLKKAFENNKTVFTIFFERKDYKELIEKITINFNDTIIMPINPLKISLNFKINSLIFAIKYINSKIRTINNFVRLYLIIKVYFYVKFINELNKNFEYVNLFGKNYVPFNSSVGIEAVLTSFFNNKKVNTYHIFHGIFGKYKLKIANDIINGENIIAENILAFSEIQRDDLIRDFGRDPKKVYIAGNPKYPFKKISISLGFSKGLVLNGFSYYDYDFIKLLIMLNELSYDLGLILDIKPHPTSKILNFKEIKKLNKINFLSSKKTLNEILINGTYDFAISYNTSTYYDCMYNNLICLRYGVNENMDLEGLDDKFFNKATFLERVSFFKNSNVQEINEQIEKLLVKAVGMGINKYKEIILDN